MQEEVTQKTVTFCIRATKITADLLKKGSCCVSASSEAEISREESTEKSAETGKGHGKRAGKNRMPGWSISRSRTKISSPLNGMPENMGSIML